ncbi:MAG: tetratricopeptide repeat protein [Candidatus Omnitrophota bacterium]
MKNRNLLAFVLIILLGFAAYANSLNNGFVYDDELVAQDRSFLSSWDNLRYFLSPVYFSGSGEYTFRPVLTLTYLFDYTRGNGKPESFHQTSLVFHIINALLLYLLLLQIIPFLDKRLNFKLVALLASLIFVVHPIQTESVDGIAFREEILVAFFSLISLLFFIMNKIKGKAFLLIISLISYFLALLCKESALSLIPIIFLVDLFYEDKTNKKERFTSRFKLHSYIGYFAVLITYIYIRFFWMKGAGEISALVNTTYPGGSLYTSILTSSRIILKYLALLVFPFPLSVEYYNYYIVYPSRSFFEPKTFASLIFLFSLSVFLIRNFWKYRLFTFSILWFFIWLGPVINLLPLNHPLAERYLYIPAAGFFIILSVVIINPLYFKARATLKQNINKVQIYFLIFLFSGYLILTINRNKIWKNPIIFWNEAMKQPPNSARAYTNLGYAYFKKGMYDEAIKAYQQSIKESPDYADPYMDLSLVFLELRNYDQAQQNIEIAMRLKPGSALSHNQQGRIFLAKKDYLKAQAEFEKAIEIEPFYAPAFNNLAICYFRQGDYEKAIEGYKKVLNLNLRPASVYVNLGLAYLLKNDLSSAEENFLIALKIDPQLVDAYNNLGVIYLRQGRNDRARDAWEMVLKIDRGHSEARRNLESLKTPK